MKILFAIPHYYQPTANNQRGHGSMQQNDARRIRAVSHCLLTIQQLFGRPQCVIDIAHRTTTPANHATTTGADVIVCTTGDKHLLPRLHVGPTYYTHRATQAEPLYLGYECHAALRERLGQYDFYCYLEDDLVFNDPWFFVKLRWFVNHCGEECVLMPNRYEVAQDSIVHKAYVDGPLKPTTTARWQAIEQQPELNGEALGQRIHFRRTTNPHSGGFFLTQTQFARWAKQPYFMDRAKDFISPLESAATLGVMRTFRVYKPSVESAAFLEIEHFIPAFLPLIRPKQAPATDRT